MGRKQAYKALAAPDDDTDPPGWPPGWTYPPPPYPPGWVDIKPYYSDYWNGGWSSTGTIGDVRYNNRWEYTTSAGFTSLSGEVVTLNDDNSGGCSLTHQFSKSGLPSSYSIKFNALAVFSDTFQRVSITHRNVSLRIKESEAAVRLFSGDTTTIAGDFKNGSWEFIISGADYQILFNNSVVFSESGVVNDLGQMLIITNSNPFEDDMSSKFGAIQILDSSSEEIEQP